MKTFGAGPPIRRQTSSGTARQAPESADTSPAPGAAEIGSPCIPGPTMPGEGGGFAGDPAPDDAGEVDWIAGRVDRRPVGLGDERLPGRPAAAVEPRPADRLA